MKPVNFDINTIIDSLNGTCKTLAGTVEECYPDMTLDDLTQKDYDDIDNNVFECQTCNWWDDISEQSNNDSKKCKDCASMEGDDEDEDE